MHYFRNKLVARLQNAARHCSQRWHGFRLLAADKTTLTLPESTALWRKFGCHKNSHGPNALAAELCTLFCVATQVPLKYIVARSYTSEQTLVHKLLRFLKKGDLLLLDNGFYNFEVFTCLCRRCCAFICPAASSYRPRVLQRLGPDDFLAEIRQGQGKSAKRMTVRVVYVYRPGFRRRRLVTSLLDPKRFPRTDIQNLYCHRWTVETFFRDFKHTMQTATWHCRTVHAFQLELCSHMIAVTLLRTVMFEAAAAQTCPVWRISFSKALVQFRLFFRRLLSAVAATVEALAAALVARCAAHKTDVRPGRSFPRQKHRYRQVARGKKRPGRSTRPEPARAEHQREKLLYCKDGVYMLS